MLSIILSVPRKSRPVRVQAALVISYYRSVVIEGTAPGVGRGKELLLSAEDGVHPNPVARGLAQRVRTVTFWRPWVGPELEAIGQE